MRIHLDIPRDRFRDIIEFIEDRFHTKVYLIGSKALQESGLSPLRPIEDIDLYSWLTLQERIRLRDYVSNKYEAPYNALLRSDEKLTIHIPGEEVSNLISHLYDNSWDDRIVEVNGAETRIPPLEDLLIMKMLSPRTKDRYDVKRALLSEKSKIDLSRLEAKVNQAQILSSIDKSQLAQWISSQLAYENYQT